MEKGRKTKIITIVALLVAIVTMSLGFAVFSNVLTISSSATVKPNAEDYIITIYGAAEQIPEDSTTNDLPTYMTSKTTSVPRLQGAFDATPAVIDNRNFTISNLNVTFSSDSQGAGYIFLISNEGKKSVYINYDNAVIGDRECIAGEGTSQDLVDQACSKIGWIASSASSTGEAIGNTGSYEIIPNDFVFFQIVMFSSGEEFVVDGEFTVNFEDIQIEFSSVDNSQSS